MNLIHIADPQGRKESYDPQEAQRLWNAGGIPRDSIYWREGMTEWRPAIEYFVSPPTPTASDTLPPVITGPGLRGFVKDPAGLTRFLIVMLWVYLVVVGGLSILMTAISLVTGQASQPKTEGVPDLASMLVALPQLLVGLVTSVVFLMWIHRANRNARGLGAQGMTFTPGWSVGWYFVPIVNFWKPYQAMQEIWRASAAPTSWPLQKTPTLLNTWWTLWILIDVLSYGSIPLTMAADTAPEMVANAIITLICDLLAVPLCLVAIRMVREIIRLQTHWAMQPIQPTCEVCRKPLPASDMIFLNNMWVCAPCKPILLQQIQEGVVKR